MVFECYSLEVCGKQNRHISQGLGFIVVIWFHCGYGSIVVMVPMWLFTRFLSLSGNHSIYHLAYACCAFGN